MVKTLLLAAFWITQGATTDPHVKVSGRVVHMPLVQGLRVLLEGTALPVPLEAPVNGDRAGLGVFTFPQVPPGAYSARLIGGPLPAQPVEFIVGGKGVKDLRIPYTSYVVVKGSIVFDGPDKHLVPPPITLVATPTRGPADSTSVQSGSFQLTLDNRDYALSVRDLPPHYRLKSITYGPTNLMKTPLNLDVVHAFRLGAIVVTLTATSADPARPGVTIRGQVTGWIEKIPIPRRLLISGPGPSDVKEIAIANNGKFSLRGVQPGTYTLRLQNVSPSLSEPKTIVVAGRDVSGVHVAIPVRIEATGQVIDESGKVVAAEGMIVQLERAGVTIPIAVGPDGSFSVTLLEGNQQLSMQGLPTGYVVKSIFLDKHYLSDFAPLAYFGRSDATSDVTKRPVKISRKNIGDRFALRITLAAR